jgi:hypothetical protein
VRGKAGTSLRFGSSRSAALFLTPIALLCAGGAYLLYRFDPAKCAVYPPCLFHVITGMYCPGCGSTRALYQLLHGHVVKAFRFNPLMVAALPFLSYALVAEGVFAVTGRTLPTFRPKWNLARTILYIIVAYWILRNVPIYPFTLLAPGGAAPWR